MVPKLEMSDSDEMLQNVILNFGSTPEGKTKAQISCIIVILC